MKNGVACGLPNLGDAAKQHDINLLYTDSMYKRESSQLSNLSKDLLQCSKTTLHSLCKTPFAAMVTPWTCGPNAHCIACVVTSVN